MTNQLKDKPSIIVNIVFGFIGLIILFLYLISSDSVPSLNEYVQQEKKKSDLTSISYPGGMIYATLATTSLSLENGLGGLRSMPKDEGMLFVFHEVGQRGFWMRNMFFPIDIVWINKDKIVTGIVSNVSPESYPNIFFPPEPVLYVLELNAGYAQKNNLATGTLLTFVI